MTFNSVAGPIEIVYPSNIEHITPHERIQCKSHFPQFGYLKNLLPPLGVFSPSITLSTTAVHNFTTGTSEIVKFHDKEKFLLHSLAKKLTSRYIDISATSFEEAIEDAALHCLTNFSTPTHAILFHNNVMIMGEFNSDSISFKEVTPDIGALIVYSPYKFNICKLPVSCPYMPPAHPKYDAYVQYVLIHETLKRLDLV